MKTGRGTGLRGLGLLDCSAHAPPAGKSHGAVHCRAYQTEGGEETSERM